MKKNIVIFIIILFNTNVWGGNYVDSLFSKHIESLEKSILLNSKKTPVNISDAEFVYMISFITDIEITYQSYTSYPLLDRNDLHNIQKWYFINKRRINEDKIKWYFILMNRFKYGYDEKKGESLEEFYNKLDIEFQHLMKVPTLIQ